MVRARCIGIESLRTGVLLGPGGRQDLGDRALLPPLLAYKLVPDQAADEGPIIAFELFVIDSVDELPESVQRDLDARRTTSPPSLLRPSCAVSGAPLRRRHSIFWAMARTSAQSSGSSWRRSTRS